MDPCEDDHRAGDGHKHEEEEEAVGHAEDGEGEVVVVFDPVVAAAQAAHGDGQGGHQLAEDDGAMQGVATCQPTICWGGIGKCGEGGKGGKGSREEGIGKCVRGGQGSTRGG